MRIASRQPIRRVSMPPTKYTSIRRRYFSLSEAGSINVEIRCFLLLRLLNVREPNMVIAMLITQKHIMRRIDEYEYLLDFIRPSKYESLIVDPFSFMKLLISFMARILMRIARAMKHPITVAASLRYVPLLMRKSDFVSAVNLGQEKHLFSDDKIFSIIVIRNIKFYILDGLE